MNYYYLKIGWGNAEANDWLEGRNPLSKPAAVIYFDNWTEADYRDNKQGKSQPRSYWQRGLDEKVRDETRMVVVSRGEVWVLKPSSPVVFLPEIQQGQWRVTPKAMPVEKLARRPMKEVPPVLAGIGVNQFYGRGTFRPIKHPGNLKAIDYVTGALFTGGHWQGEPDLAQLLGCLGSVEFET